MAIGPGLVVMLADTDAGSVITAAQSGAERGYQLLLPQLLIVPVLFIAQELALRLGLVTGKGCAELVKLRLGRSCALLYVAALLISCFGALLTQMSGLAGVGQLVAVPVWVSVSLVAMLIFVVLRTGSYLAVERIAIFLGLFELAFLLVAWRARPDFGTIVLQLRQAPLQDPRFLYLLARRQSWHQRYPLGFGLPAVGERGQGTATGAFGDRPA